MTNKQATIIGAATTITSSNLTASRALISNSSGKVAVSAVTSTELGYLDGVTSKIQTQIDDLKTNVTDINGKYLPLTGGTLTGQLYLSGETYIGVRMKNTSVGSGTYVQAWDQSAALIAYNTYGDTSNRRAIFLRTSDNTSNGNLSNSLVLRDDVDSSATYYNIYGEHNCKPTSLTMTIYNSGDTFDVNYSKYFDSLGFAIVDVSVHVESRGMTPGSWLKICRIKSGCRPKSLSSLSCVVEAEGTVGIYQAFADTDGYIQIFSKTGNFSAGTYITFSVNGCYIIA